MNEGEEILERVLEGARQELLEVPSAAIAEYWASVLARIWHERAASDPEAGAVFGGRLIDFAHRSARPEALALLRVLAAVEGEDLAGPAAAAADDLARRGVPDAPWAGDLGRARPTRAVAMREDDFDDGTSLLVEFEHPDGRRHTVGVYIDHNLGHMAKDAFLAGSLDEVADSLEGGTKPEAVRIEPVALAEAGGLLADAVGVTDRTVEPPVSETYWGLRALLGARIRALPAGRPRPARVEVRPEERLAIIDAFVASPEAAGLGAAPDVAEVAALLVDFAADDVDGRPLRWSPIVVELCLADWFPRAVVAERAFLALVPDVLRAFIRYAGRLRALPTAAVEETVAAVDRWEGRLLAGPDAADDPDDPDDDMVPGDEAAWILAQVEADRMAAETLRLALEDHQGESPPRELAGADPGLLIRSAGACTGTWGGVEVDVEAEALVVSLERADWLGAVVELVRAGPGTAVDGGSLVAAVERCPEVDGEVSDDDRELVAAAFEVVLPAWRACGVLDADNRLTPVGAWVLPRALGYAWDVDFDTGAFL